MATKVMTQDDYTVEDVVNGRVILYSIEVTGKDPIRGDIGNVWTRRLALDEVPIELANSMASLLPEAELAELPVGTVLHTVILLNSPVDTYSNEELVAEVKFGPMNHPEIKHMGNDSIN